MHDIVNMEGRQIPSVFVASTEFVVAAAAQSTALGYDPASVFVQHPIQDRTDEEIRELAAEALPQIMSLLLAKT